MGLTFKANDLLNPRPFLKQCSELAAKGACRTRFTYKLQLNAHTGYDPFIQHSLQIFCSNDSLTTQIRMLFSFYAKYLLFKTFVKRSFIEINKIVLQKPSVYFLISTSCRNFQFVLALTGYSNNNNGGSREKWRHFSPSKMIPRIVKVWKASWFTQVYLHGQRKIFERGKS